MDFYGILGVDRGASAVEIKRAYRRLARKYHPDINPGDRAAAGQFRLIVEAYETLIDPERRRRYDAGAEAAGPGAPASTFGFEGFDFSASASGASASTFGELFAEVLTPRGAADEAPERGADLHHAITLSFEQAARGGEHTVTVTRQVPCRGCSGRGQLSVAESLCGTCQGTGTIRSARGHMVFSKACGACAGTGRLRRVRCPRCGGGQVETRTETLQVSVPPGVADGARLRVPGRGHAGRNGGEPGDLYVTVSVQPHRLFRREGDDLHLTVPVAIHEAALGTRFEVPTLDGPARVRIPPGTQSGQRFRLHERGLPSARTGRRGDLVIEVRLVLPAILDERSKELLREFGRINAADVRAELYTADDQP